MSTAPREEFRLQQTTKQVQDLLNLLTDNDKVADCILVSDGAKNVQFITLEDLKSKLNIAGDLITEISADNTDTQYPSAKAVYDHVNSALAASIGEALNGEY